MKSLKTRNFTTDEIIHRPHTLPEDLRPIAYFAHGYIQCLRDALSREFKREVPLVINSGYRDPKYNASLPGASKTSYHQWRYDQSRPVFALDIRVVGVPLEKAFQVISAIVVGECYIHRDGGFIHVAPYGPDESWSK